MDTLALKVVEQINEANPSVIFRDDVAIACLLGRANVIRPERMIFNINFDWAGGWPSNNQLIVTMRGIVKGINKKLNILLVEECKDREHVIMDVVSEENMRAIFNMSVGFRERGRFIRYNMVGNRRAINGYTVEQLVADRILLISDRCSIDDTKVKAMYDLYLLASISGYCVDNVMSIINSYRKKLGNFSDCLCRKDAVRNEYNKLEGIENKPDFNLLWSRVDILIEPFIREVDTNKVWNGVKWDCELAG